MRVFLKRRGAHLPHWAIDGATYFVTFRLGDSVPKSRLEEWRWERWDIVETARQRNRPLTDDEMIRLNKLHSEKVEKYLQTGHGACWLRRNDVAEIVAQALQRFEGERYKLFAWCIMPNHVHVVFQPFGEHPLNEVMHSWKSYTANEVNKILNRKGQLWQVEYYDHWIRDEDDFCRCINYVWSNPDKAGMKNWKWRWKIPEEELIAILEANP